MVSGFTLGFAITATLTGCPNKSECNPSANPQLPRTVDPDPFCELRSPGEILFDPPAPSHVREYGASRELRAARLPPMPKAPRTEASENSRDFYEPQKQSACLLRTRVLLWRKPSRRSFKTGSESKHAIGHAHLQTFGHHCLAVATMFPCASASQCEWLDQKTHKLNHLEPYHLDSL